MNVPARLQPHDGDRGAVIPVVALSLVFLMTMTSFAVDLGRVMVRNRDLQKVSDLVALDLARQIDGRTVNEINADPTFTQQMYTSGSRNGFDIGDRRTLTYQLGAVDQSTRQFHELHGDSVPNAVRVTSADVVGYFFTPGTRNVSRAAVGLGSASPLCLPNDPTCTPCPPGDATCSSCPLPPGFCALTTASTDFEVGSFLASENLDDTQVRLLNALFSRVGTGVTLDAVSYQGLAAAQLTERQLAAALGLGSPDDLFTTTVSYRDLLLASASALQSNGGAQAAITALQTIAYTVDRSKTISWSSMVAKGSGFRANVGQGTSAFDAYLKLMNIVEASAFVINGTNFMSLPSITFTQADDPRIPGNSTITVTGSLKVIETPRTMQFAHVGDQLQTSQVDLNLTVTLDLDLSALRAGERLRGTMTVHPQSASATASPSLIVCPGGSIKPEVDIAVAGSPISTSGNESLTESVLVGALSVDALSVNVGTVSITSGGSDGTATFMYNQEFLPSVGSGGMKRTATQSLNLGSGYTVTMQNSTLLGLPPITQPDLVNDANDGLNPVYSVLDNKIVPKILGTLGAELGGADVAVSDMHCTSGAVLVH